MYFESKLFFLFVLITINFQLITSEICRGCTELDDKTFTKIVKKFPITIVKFDIAFPYGEKHEQYALLANEYSETINDLLIAVVGVKDYGEKDNLLLAKSFNVNEANFPSIKLFKNDDLTKWMDFPNDLEITVENLKKFIRVHTHIYIGLDGCIEQLDKLSTDFVNSYKNGEIQKLDKILTEINLIEFKTEKDKESMKIYTAIMKRIKEKSVDFVVMEQERLRRILASKITETKKNELNIRLNILQSFIVHETHTEKIEL